MASSSASYGRAGTFTYAPDIKVGILTQAGKYIDVSEHIIDFSLDRELNAVSTFQVQLSNPGMQYNYGKPNAISTMDRITVFLKRTSFVQVFSGYITYAPIETLIPTPITIIANCTLRRLQVTYWDDTLIDFQVYLLNYMNPTMASADKGTNNDGGVAQAVVNLLYKVAGWNQNTIHIQEIPNSFLSYAATVYSNFVNTNYVNQNAVTDLLQIVGNGIVSGSSITTGGTKPGQPSTLSDTTAPDGSDITIAKKVSKAIPFINKTGIKNTGGDGNTLTGAVPQYYAAITPESPVQSNGYLTEDIYWCAAPWNYLTYKNDKANKKIIQDSINWLANISGHQHGQGRLMVLTDIRTQRECIVRATSVPQAMEPADGKAQPITDIQDIDYVQVHPGVVAYLSNQVDDPTKWSNQSVTYANIRMSWADELTTSVGPQTKNEQAIAQEAQSLTGTTINSNTPNVANIVAAIDEVVTWCVSKIGTPYGTGSGELDCSAMVQDAYQIPVALGANGYPFRTSEQQWGSGSSADNNTHGIFIPPSQMPMKGDVLFWNVFSDTQAKPNHVMIMATNFDPKTGKARTIHANDTGNPLSIDPTDNELVWSSIKNGGVMTNWGMQYMGARRPISLHHGWGKYVEQNASKINSALTGSVVDVNGVTLTNPNDPTTAASLNLSGAWNTIFQPPQFDVRASIIAGTPRAFLLDNPIMPDLEAILSSGLRMYQSAPNGDFVAFFPDYYGIWSQSPTINVSPVEIIDFQIYHDDNQLVTHYGVVGDTNGIGQQVSFVDWLTTNGIVSIQDTSTMQLLFGKLIPNGQQSEGSFFNAIQFLNTYGMRPLVDQQSVIHSHAAEYMYALFNFMKKWTDQFVSTVTFTFMPEIYPGMLIKIEMDDTTGALNTYQFFVTAVIHQGSRSGGFTTQVTLTAPMKNGYPMHYGLGL